METNFQKIKELISKSNLTTPEKDELIWLFAQANDLELEPVLTLFEENSRWITKISQNYQAKQAAMMTDNSKLWQKIIQEEETQLKKLENEHK